MNKKWVITAGIIAILTGWVPYGGSMPAVAQPSVSFQVFYDRLSPYGTWVDYPGYGYAWIPGAGAGFRPYHNRGHWVYTDEGWAWVSDYDWGWAAFHYGSWLYDDAYGWMWLPGYQWAPAWVTWGEYGDNYCWAPIGPRIDIGVSFGTYRPPFRYWNFCPRGHINSVNINNYYVRNISNTTVVNRITIINNQGRANGGGAYLRGPAPSGVERFTHHPINPVAIQGTSRPGPARVQGGRLAIYRPELQHANASPARPARVQDIHASRPANGGVRPGAYAGAVNPSSRNSSVNNAPVRHAPRQAPAAHQAPDQRQSPAPRQMPSQRAQMPSQHTQMPVQHPSQAPHQMPPAQQRQMAPQRQAPPQRQMPVQHQMPVQRPMPVQRQMPQQRQAQPETRMQAQRPQPGPPPQKENQQEHHR